MKIAILGMGTIGSGVYELCRGRKDIKVLRTLDLRAWMDDMTTDIQDIVNDSQIETVVETMGGLHPAREYALKCIESGKNYVTANKHLVSEFGLELKAAADKAGKAFYFSAACGGGIPYLKNLSGARDIDGIKAVGGILNGTTNFILDSMQSEGMDYAEALRIAQDLGYAERDPSSDVDGLDTQRKLALACGVAYGKLPKASEIPTFGIRNILKADIDFFSAKGLVVRLVASACESGDGVSACVQPVLVKAGSPESGIRKNVNYAWYDGDRTGLFAFSGQGAGKFPTGANIIRDMLAIAAGEKGLFPTDTKPCEVKLNANHAYYVRVPKSSADGIKTLLTDICEKDGWCVAETVPMADAEAHKILSAIPGAFFAALA